jgi:hypothetical protein
MWHEGPGRTVAKVAFRQGRGTRLVRATVEVVGR